MPYRAGYTPPSHSGPPFHYNGTIYRERRGVLVESKQAWDIGIGALVGAVLGGILGRLSMGPGFGLYVGIALGAVVGVFLGAALSRR